MIAKLTSITKGARGPSYFDAEQFRTLLSKKFKTEAKELRK